MTPLDAINQHRYTYFGFKDVSTADHPYQYLPALCYSDNLTNWDVVQYYPELGNCGAQSVAKISDWYYVIATGYLMRTKNFVEFDKLDNPLDKQSEFKHVWAPEIFADVDGNYHVAYCATKDDSEITGFELYVADMTTDGRLSKLQQKITFYDGQLGNVRQIDPSIVLHKGVYYLATSGDYLYSATHYLGPYQRVKANFTPTPQFYGDQWCGNDGWTEAPELVKDGNFLRLFSDMPMKHGYVYRSANLSDLGTWSARSQTVCVDFDMRHGCFMVNPNVEPALYKAEINYDNKFNPTMTIKALHNDQVVPLTCYERAGFQYQYANNQTNQIQFYAYDDGSPSWPMVQLESLITFNDNWFVVKNIQPTMQGTDIVQVTAIQYVNSQITTIHQYNTQQGTLTMRPDDILKYWLNDSKVNPDNRFTYNVVGDFEPHRVENLGNGSGKDMLSKINELWPSAIIYPQKNQINVVSADAFTKPTQKRIDYIRDTSEIQLTQDSTNIVNIVRCIGATKQSDTSTAATDSGGVQLSETETTQTTGTDRTAEFQADAKKYLGVPYKWGGHDKSNPYGGMDCSGFVSQVYYDFGINVPPQTVQMEPYFYQVSDPKCGDVGFYGPHGSTHHICLMLDANTMIYEPEPGEVCKIAPVSPYPPDWYARNNNIQTKINQHKTATVDNANITFTDNYQSGIYNSEEQYYFEPFMVIDNDSISAWGPYPATSDLQDDRFTDADAMRAYAKTQLSPDPTISIVATLNSNAKPIAGEQVRLNIQPRHYSTNVTVVGWTWYPFDPTQGTQITYDNLPATILNNRATMRTLADVEKMARTALANIPQVFYSSEDPTAKHSVKNGAIWVKPINHETGGDAEHADG